MEKKNLVRVRVENGPRIVAALKAAGFEAEWLGPGTAHHSWMGGCSDSDCCPQHDCFKEPHKWGAIRTNASGRKAHRVIVQELGMNCNCRDCKRSRNN
ncbi:MAG: hypothetical protein DRN26_01130 [Thermoplasmata archaeon]|nr:MAG: hypothetical protein DRN26_01130 [Thermoplasmata archaeon]